MNKPLKGILKENYTSIIQVKTLKIYLDLSFHLDWSTVYKYNTYIWTREWKFSIIGTKASSKFIFLGPFYIVLQCRIEGGQSETASIGNSWKVWWFPYQLPGNGCLKAYLYLSKLIQWWVVARAKKIRCMKWHCWKSLARTII